VSESTLTNARTIAVVTNYELSRSYDKIACSMKNTLTFRGGGNRYQSGGEPPHSKRFAKTSDSQQSRLKPEPLNLKPLADFGTLVNPGEPYRTLQNAPRGGRGDV
jgi:hypothetical protein